MTKALEGKGCLGHRWVPGHRSGHREAARGGGCLGRGEEIAAMVAYLAGPEAGFVTGASLTIDDGFAA